ncbi:MAG: tetratricopeptide repeat protein [Bacillota bacterium]|nr:tetratricopeptide repeat protein [Bacillota bacterium]
MKRLEKTVEERRKGAGGSEPEKEGKLCYFEDEDPEALALLEEEETEVDEGSLRFFGQREDRVGKYFKKYLKDFVFDEFSPRFLAANPKIAFMSGVPIPLRKVDAEAFRRGEGVENRVLAENMAWVLGADPKFRYNEMYVKYITTYFNVKGAEGFLKEGRDEAEKEEFDAAAIHLRASMMIVPNSFHTIYSYARVCREQYLKSNNPEYIGRFKAESIDYFELLTEVKPNFAYGYYYLGFGYLNMGLYTKAYMTWELFLKYSRSMKDKKEIRTKQKDLEHPMAIEAGCNSVMAGRWREGLQTLEPYTKTSYKDWWPLSYYLGVSYRRLGSEDRALESFRRVLELNPSHLETMEELVQIYRERGDGEGESKYKKKIELIKKQLSKANRNTEEE